MVYNKLMWLTRTPTSGTKKQNEYQISFGDKFIETVYSRFGIDEITSAHESGIIIRTDSVRTNPI